MPQRKLKPPGTRRPALPKASEEMKAWSAALIAEVATWPNVTTRPMFGFTSLYRKSRIFAALPKTRGMESPHAFGFKLDSLSRRFVRRLRCEPRVRTIEDFSKTRWLTFEMNSADDFSSALEWLNWAYEAARQTEAEAKS
jgi:TfoX/Sxy family transcriptional regulator of competence genes